MADDFLQKWGLDPTDLPAPPDVGVGPTKTYDFNAKWFGEQEPSGKTPKQPFTIYDTWPARLMKSIGSALVAPGQAFKSTPENPVTTEELISPAGNLATLMPTGALPSVMSKAEPLINTEIARLMKTAREEYGIPIRGSQMSPSMKRTDLMAGNAPFTGIEKSNAVQQEAFNRIINKAMGIDAPKVNRDVIDQVKSNYHTVIEDVTDRIGKLKFDDQAHADILDTFKNAHIDVPDKIQTIQNKIRTIADNVDENGFMNAKTYKGLMRKNGPLDPEGYDGKLEHHVSMLRNNMKELLARNASKEDVNALRLADQRYAVMKSIEKKALDSPTGDISPPSLMRVTPSYSVLSDLAKIGQVMKPASSSGTAENISANRKLALTTGLGAVEGAMAYHDPMLALKVTLGALGLGAAKGLGNMAYGKYLRSNYLANRLINRSLPEQVAPANPLQELLRGKAIGYQAPAAMLSDLAAQPFQIPSP